MCRRALADGCEEWRKSESTLPRTIATGAAAVLRHPSFFELTAWGRDMGIECAFVGALARDAESKTSKSGKEYLRFTVRVGDGDDADWVTVTSFDDRALEFRAKFVKGARVYVEGKLSLNKRTDQSGVQKTGLSVMSFHSHLAEIGKNKPPREHQTTAAARRDPVKRSAPPDDSLDF